MLLHKRHQDSLKEEIQKTRIKPSNDNLFSCWFINEKEIACQDVRRRMFLICFPPFLVWLMCQTVSFYCPAHTGKTLFGTATPKFYPNRRLQNYKPFFFPMYLCPGNFCQFGVLTRCLTEVASNLNSIFIFYWVFMTIHLHRDKSS